MPQPSHVSVVLTCFNYGHLLPRAMKSVRDQTLRSWEMVIVDDGSTDASRQTAQSFADDNPGLSITLVFTRNGGVSRARNLGISVSRGQYIVCLDADDHFAPTALEKLSHALDEDLSVDVARPFLQSFGVSSHIWKYADYDFAALTSANQAPYCAMFRRKAWERLDGYDETIPAYEDWNFWLSLGEHGSRMTVVPEPLHHYRTNHDGLFARNRHRDLELRATIVTKHPGIYDQPSQQLARQILAGKNVDAELADNPPHPIFSLAYRARTLRGEDTSLDFGEP